MYSCRSAAVSRVVYFSLTLTHTLSLFKVLLHLILAPSLLLLLPHPFLLIRSGGRPELF